MTYGRNGVAAYGKKGALATFLVSRWNGISRQAHRLLDVRFETARGGGGRLGGGSPGGESAEGRISDSRLGPYVGAITVAISVSSAASNPEMALWLEGEGGFVVHGQIEIEVGGQSAVVPVAVRVVPPPPR